MSNSTKLRLLALRAEVLCTNYPNGLKDFLTNMQHLEYLVIVGPAFESLLDDTFADLLNIEQLCLIETSLEELPEQIFKNQIELRRLLLHNNRLRMLPAKLFSETKKLNVLKLSHNKLQSIPEGLFDNLHQLTELHLDENELKKIHSNAFEYLVGLQELHLQNNQLDSSSFPVHSSLRNMKELNRLNLSNNSIEDYLYCLNDYASRIEFIDLSSNNISQVDLRTYTVFWNTSRTTDLSNNPFINTLDIATSSEYDFHFKPFEEKASNTHISERIVARFRVETTWILNGFWKYCSCNNLTELKGFISFLDKWNSILVTNELICRLPNELTDRKVDDMNTETLFCPIDYGCPDYCKCYLKESHPIQMKLNCANANLTTTPVLTNLTRNDFSSLQIDIGFNRINSLPNKSSEGFKLITKIDAKNNSIESIGAENLPDILEELNLSYNKLKTLTPNVLQRITEMKNLTKISLKGNPLVCECEGDLFEFIRHNPDKCDYQYITCSDGASINEADDACRGSNKPYLLLIPVFLVLTLIGFSIATYKTFEQEIKVWLFAHNLCLWFISEEEVDKDKKYDAFISYSHKDEDVVKELESGPNPFKICVHTRDWLAGEFITDQIARSVAESCRTIIILSSNFLESHWAPMEFRLAHLRALDEQRVRLIVIIYGNIGDVEGLAPEIKAYLRTNTYLEWNDPSFFDKLRFALPHKSNRASKTNQNANDDIPMGQLAPTAE